MINDVQWCSMMFNNVQLWKNEALEEATQQETDQASGSEEDPVVAKSQTK